MVRTDRRPRRRLDPDSRRAAILEAAAAAFAAHPYAEVTISSIAAEAYSSNALVYRYFANKEDLYAEVVRVAIADLLTRQAEALDALPDGVPVRDRIRAARLLPAGTTLLVGDATDTPTVANAVEDVDAVVFTHGSHGGEGEAESIDYGIVSTVLGALRNPDVHVSLMTTIGITVHDSLYNRATQAYDWKRRSERLVRRSGHPYTIVRPGWFGQNKPDQRKLVFLQGDTRRVRRSSDGAIARDEIARVLIDAIAIPKAAYTTLELVSERGPEQPDLVPLFAALEHDEPGTHDAILDPDTLPLSAEPPAVLEQLEAICQVTAPHASTLASRTSGAN